MTIEISNSKYLMAEAKVKKEVQKKNEPLVPVSQKQMAEVPSVLLKGAYGVIPFKGQKINGTKNNAEVSFGANPLLDINLKKLINKQYEFVPAKFSELVIGDNSDQWAMLNLEELWKNKTELTGSFVTTFFNSKGEESFYLTEIPDSNKELFDRITCLLKTTNPKVQQKESFDVHILQSSPCIANVKNSPIKGSGELSLYAATRLAKENGFKKVRLNSLNDSFYDNMEFKKVEVVYKDEEFPNEGGIYELPAELFDEFLERVEKKYNFKNEK